MKKYIVFAGLGSALLLAFMASARLSNRANAFVEGGRAGSGFIEDEEVIGFMGEDNEHSFTEETRGGSTGKVGSRSYQESGSEALG